MVSLSWVEICRRADCSVCKNDDACAAFQTRYPGNDGTGSQGNETNDMVCYKGGLAIERNWQMCDVTSKSGLQYFHDLV